MNAKWQGFLAAAGAHCEPGESNALKFGCLKTELEQARSGSILAPLTHLGAIECSGEDATIFLHHQLSSDIQHLGTDLAQHSSWCTAQGRMVASFIVWHTGQGLLLATAADLVAPLVKRFQKYVLRSKVQLKDQGDDLILLGLAGEKVPAALRTAGLPLPEEKIMACSRQGDAIVIRLEHNRFLLALPVESACEQWSVLRETLCPVGISAWRWLDIESGLPWVTAATCEEFVPQMADFDKIGGVSFHKGCYPGQEIIARTRYLGKVKRHLFRLDSPVPLQPGDDLHSPEHPGQAIGKIISSAPNLDGGYRALAVLLSSYAADAHLRQEDGPLLKAEAVYPCA